MDSYYSFRRVFLPYCLKRLADGRYIVLNRQYKPLGVRSSEHVVYEDHPTAGRIEITPEQAVGLSWDGSNDLDLIRLYNGESVDAVDGNTEHLKAYQLRLERLMHLKVLLR